MNEIINLCENPRGRFFGKIAEKFYPKGRPKEGEELEYFERELFEIKCKCRIWGYSDKRKIFFCKICNEFTTAEKKKIRFILVNDLGDNELHPIWLKFNLPSIYPYFGLNVSFENQIIFLDNPFLLGEVLRRSKNCKIYLFGKCLNVKRIDKRVKLVFLSFTSEFEDFEIDGLLIKRAERKIKEIESLKEKEKDGESPKILESLVKINIESALNLLRSFKFWRASKIILEFLPSIFLEFKNISYSIKEYEKCLNSYYYLLDLILEGFGGKEEKLEVSEEALKAFNLINRAIEDIKFLKEKLKNRRTCYIAPQEYLDYFCSLEEYIKNKVDMNVKIVEKLPREKKIKGKVGIYLE